MASRDDSLMNGRVVALLRPRRRLTADEIAGQLGVDRFGLQNALERLAKRGKVLRVPAAPGRGPWGRRVDSTLWEPSGQE